MIELPVVPHGIIDDEPGLGDWCILHAFRGSLSMNLFVPKNDPDSIDDVDTIAVCVPPIDYYFGMNQFYRRGTKEIKIDEWDMVIYDAHKMLSMLLDGNPNVLSMLWLDPKYYIKLSEAGQLLIDNRDLFVGRHVYQSFIGYAQGQLHRMTHYSGREPTEIKQLAYAFDTNGRVDIFSHAKKEDRPDLPIYGLSVSLRLLSRDIIQYLYDEYGGLAFQEIDEDHWTWQTYGQLACKFLKTVSPFLMAQTAQAQNGINFYNFILNRKKNRAFTSDDLEKIEEMRTGFSMVADLSSQVIDETVSIPFTRAYMGKKRRELVDRFGYDSKNASHLIRLLRMGIEFLYEGELHVERVDDRDELLAIKRGEWSLDKINAEANLLFAEAQEAYKNSKLPDEPNKKAVNELCAKVVRMALVERGEV